MTAAAGSPKPGEHPGDAPPDALSSSLQPNPAADASSQRPQATDSTRTTNNTGETVLNIGESKSVSVIFGTPSGAASTEWTDPSHPASLPPPLDADDLPIEIAVAQLREQRFTLIECPWNDLRWRAAASLANELGIERYARGGVISDAASSETSADPRRARGRFGLEDLKHPGLGPDTRVVVLELNGAAGSAYFDAHFSSPGTLRALTAVLREADRYLLVLPYGHHQTSARRDRTGLKLPRLAVPFLPLWLRKRFGEHFEPLLGLIRQKLQRHDWANEEALFEWLDSLPAQHGAEDMQRTLSDDSGEPRPLQAVREALDGCDEKDEVFLTTVFVATYLPSLPQHELSEVVQALLGDRTRRLETSRDHHPPLEIALADEWLSTARIVLKRADLEVRQTGSGTRVVAFRATNAPPCLRRELDAAPMFVESQLQRLQRSGLLFHLRPAIRDAVIELLLVTTAGEPGRITADWLLDMLGRRTLQAEPTTTADSAAATSATVTGEEWISVNFLSVAKLLRRMIDVDPSGLAIVNGVLGGMMHRKSLLRAGIELAYRLRHAPGFDIWRWLRRGIEVATKAHHEMIQQQLFELVESANEGVAALRALFSWLHSEGDTLSELAKTTAKAIGVGMATSFEPAAERSEHLPSPMLALLEEEATSAAAPSPGKGLQPVLAAIARHMDIERVESRYLAHLLLPSRTLDALPPEVRERREEEFEHLWGDAYEANRAAWAPRRSAPLRLAMCLAAWRVAHPHRSALLQAVTAAARAFLGAERRAAQEWVGRLEQILTRCETLAAADLVMPEDQRKRWLRDSRANRRGLIELRDWLAQPATTSAPPPSEPSLAVAPSPDLSRKEPS